MPITTTIIATKKKYAVLVTSILYMVVFIFTAMVH